MTLRWQASRVLATGVSMLFAFLCQTAAAQSASDERNERLDFLIDTLATTHAHWVGNYPETAVPRLLRFSNGKRVGFMDLKGAIVIPPIFDGANFFIDGRVRVSRNKKWGFIDSNGKIALALKYEDLGLLWRFPMPAKMDGLWGLIDERGDWILQPAYEHLEVGNNVVTVKTNGKWGLLDLKGQSRVMPAYDRISVFDKTCVVQVGQKSGLIDMDGKVLIEPQYDQVYGLADGYAIVVRNGRSALIRVDRPAVSLFEHDQIYPAHKRQRWIIQDRQSYGVVDSQGKEIIKQQYATIETNRDDRFNVTLAGMKALADNEGRFLTRFQFQYIGYFQHGLAAVKVGDKYGFIDTSGEMVIEPRFGAAGSFDSELAVVSLDGKWGYIDRKGVFVIEPQFERTFPFHPDGVAVVKSEGRYVYIDRSLRRIADWMRLDVPTQEDFALRP